MARAPHHTSVLGSLGTGKTQLAMQLVRKVSAESNCAILMFDMGKGDLAENNQLVEGLGARVVSVPDEPVPLNVLSLPERTETTLNSAALYFRDSFANAAKSNLGAAQHVMRGRQSARLSGTTACRSKMYMRRFARSTKRPIARKM